MINSTSSTDRAVHPEAVAAKAQVAVRPQGQRPDQLSTENAAHLREALARQPEIRPEVVERGRALAADADYPPASTLRHVAALLVNAPDLSVDAS